MLYNALDFGFVQFTADRALGIENGILRVGMERVLCPVIDMVAGAVPAVIGLGWEAVWARLGMAAIAIIIE